MTSLDERWSFTTDTNGDGAFTISDIDSILAWLFFLPGDYVIYLLLTYAPNLARFLELSSASYGSFGSGLVSSCVWLFGIVLAWAWTSDPMPILVFVSSVAFCFGLLQLVLWLV
jgi:hypothetical protein